MKCTLHFALHDKKYLLRNLLFHLQANWCMKLILGSVYCEHQLHIFHGSKHTTVHLFVFGVVGPKTAIELGQNIFFKCPSLAKSKTLKSPSMFNSQANLGFFSAVAESKAAKRYTSVIPSSFTIALNFSLSKTFKEI